MKAPYDARANAKTGAAVFVKSALRVHIACCRSAIMSPYLLSENVTPSNYVIEHSMNSPNIKLGGTLGSPHSEIVRYRRNTEVVFFVTCFILCFPPIGVPRLRRNVLSTEGTAGGGVSNSSSSL